MATRHPIRQGATIDGNVIRNPCYRAHPPDPLLIVRIDDRGKPVYRRAAGSRRITMAQAALYFGASDAHVFELCAVDVLRSVLAADERRHMAGVMNA